MISLIVFFLGVCLIIGMFVMVRAFLRLLFTDTAPFQNPVPYQPPKSLPQQNPLSGSVKFYDSGARPRTSSATSHRTQTPAESASSGLFSSTSVNLMLLSGAALLIFSVYLFVRSYWETIPNAAKFGSLNFLTAAIYSLGYSLTVKKKITRTARTLLCLGLALLPFNAYAANVLLLGKSWTSEMTWALGCGLLCPAAILTAAVLPSLPVGFLIGAGFGGLAYFATLATGFSLQTALLALSLASTLLLGVVITMKGKQDVAEGIFFAAFVLAIFDIVRLFSQHFFVYQQTTQYATVLNLVSLAVLFVLLSRNLHANFAYAAAATLMGAGALLMKQLDLPVYEYGYGFVPIGFIALLRAWTFERSRRSALARPYFWLGQVALLASLLCVVPVFSGSRDVPLMSLMIILMAATTAYAVVGAFYKQSFYTYASGLVMFYIMTLMVWSKDMDFSAGILSFSTLACVLILSGSIGQKVNDEQVGFPLTVLGLISLTLSMALMAGRWGDKLYTTGALIDALPPDQLRAGLWTGSLSAAAYVLVAAFRKRSALLYPALFSFTWVYVCWLQKMGVPLTLFAAAWVVVVSMGSFCVLRMLKYQEAGRCFALWGEMVAIFIACGALYVQSPLALSAIVLCTLAFLPSLEMGDKDLVIAFLLGIYLSHFLWFVQTPNHHMPNWQATYALQMVAINFGVVFLRTMVTWFRPKNPVDPYRACALLFTILSGVLSLTDFQIAWQVYLAYALLAIAVSLVHYQGRFLHVGALLLLASGELFFAAQKIHYIELYTLPPAIFFLWAGYQARQKAEMRDFLYGVGLVLLYLPSSIEAMKETWQWHGIFLGLSSLAVMLFGMHQRSRVLTFGSAFVLIANGFIQSRQFFLTVPRWIYLGSGGLMLITLGGLFEFQREALIQARKKVASAFEGWD